MSTFFRALRYFLYTLLLVVLLAGLGIGWLGYTSSGNQFLANQIAEQVSTPDLRVSLRGARGLLEGRFHLDKVELADSKGQFAAIENLDLFWVPSELFRKRFHADRLAASKITFDRMPIQTQPAEESIGSFALPVEIKVDSLALPAIALGKSVAGRETVLQVAGAAQAVSDNIALDVTAAETARPDAIAKAKAAYSVNARTLMLDGSVTEPKGGLLARLLKLPGEPPVEIAVKGDGKLDDWSGKITGRVDGNDILALSGSHRLAEPGVHQVTLAGGGLLSELLPPATRSLFEGETKIDIDARLGENGLVEINSGTIANDSLVLDASGTLNPKGEAQLKADLRPAGEPISLQLPLEKGTAFATIKEAKLALTGQFRAATLDIDAILDMASVPAATLQGISLKAHSDRMDLATHSGTVNVDLTAATIALADPNAAKLVQGPLTFNGMVGVASDRITLDGAELESPKLGGKIEGAFTLADQSVSANVSLFALPQGALPPAMEAKLQGTVGLSGKVTAKLPSSSFAIRDFKLTSNLVNAAGSATLEGDTVKAVLSGDIADLSALSSAAAGPVHFALDASGPLAKPVVAAQVTGQRLMAAGRAVNDVSLNFDGAIDPSKPGGALAIGLKFRDQLINLKANIASQPDQLAISALEGTIGQNRLTGGVGLDRALLPSGKIDFDLTDIATLAKLGGQQVDGSLKGSVEFGNSDGKVTARINAAGPRLAASGAEITDPVIEMAFSDLLTQAASGKITAKRLASGASHLDKVALDLGLTGRRVTYKLESVFDNAPLTAQGDVDASTDILAINLASFAAAPKGLPLRLATPTMISVEQGVARLAALTIAVNDGTVTVDGTAGQTLDLKAGIANLPLALVNTFAGNLDAAGALNGTVTITGPASKPLVAFNATIAGLDARQLRANNLPPLNVTARGQFADNVVNADIASNIKGQPLTTKVEVHLAEGRVALPSLDVRLGKSVITGALALDTQSRPSGKLQFDLPDLNALASILGRKAEGALSGTADIASDNGAIVLAVNADGSLRNQPLRIHADVKTADGALSVPALKLDIGRNTLSGGIAFSPKFEPSGKFDFDLPDLALLAAMAGQKAEGALKGSAEVATAGARIDAKVKATGTIRDKDIDIDTQAISADGKISLPALKLTVGPNTLNGALTLDEKYLPTGKLDFDFPDIALLAAFAGQKAEGAIKGAADLKSADGKLAGTISATGPKVIAGGAEILKPVVDLTIADLSAGQVTGKIAADRIASGANSLSKLALNLDHTGNETTFDLNGQYDGAPLLAKGKVTQSGSDITVALASFSAAPKKIAVKLNQPTNIAISNGNVSLSGLAITAGQGTITVNGKAGEQLDIAAKINALPASLANSFAAGLDATGTISADVTVKGSSTAPVVTFDTRWANAATSQTRAASLGAFTINAKGGLKNNVLTISTNARGGSGLTLDAGGTIGLTGNKSLSIKANGKLPFAALAGQLAQQGMALTGDATFNLTVGGTTAGPTIVGKVTTRGATLTVIRQNLTLKEIAATIDLDGKQARISSLTGKLAAGGTVSVDGTIGIAPNSGYPANLKIALKNAVYTDGRIVASKLNGDLGLNGSLIRSPVLNGRIRLNRADITIPEKLPGALSQLDVKHKNAPKSVVVQNKEIRKDTPKKSEEGSAGGIALDLTISGPRQVFVRGRGLDAELGGDVKITGTSGSPNVSGGFKMRRGRLSIIGRRLDFTSGNITFGGNMMPALDMVASSTVNATTINVTVSGLASNPSVAFTSSPALPQDEVLALLIFGRSSASLSPVQIAQLADAVSTLAGGQSNSLFNRLRQGLGVDDLDVGTDENGKSNVSAGKYLNKRTYIQLQQGVDDGTSKAVINLDIGKGVKLRGEAGTDGSTAGGVFFEKEY